MQSIEPIYTCPECGAHTYVDKEHKAHSPFCSAQTMEERMLTIRQYHRAWLEGQETWQKHRKKAWELTNNWRRKFQEVKHENNMLRKNLAKKDQVIVALKIGLKGLVHDVRSKGNDTRYERALRVAEELIGEKPAESRFKNE